LGGEGDIIIFIRQPVASSTHPTLLYLACPAVFHCCLHAPISGNPFVTMAGHVTRCPARLARLQANSPGTPVSASRPLTTAAGGLQTRQRSRLAGGVDNGKHGKAGAAWTPRMIVFDKDGTLSCCAAGLSTGVTPPPSPPLCRLGSPTQ